MAADPYLKLVRDGKVIDALTDGAIKRAEKVLGRRIALMQGSYNAGGVAASAGTHDGGGAIDVPPGGWQEVVTALRAVGFAAWYRPAVPDLWPAHVHAVLIGNGKLSSGARNQVTAYLGRRDGLVSNAIDTDPGWTNTARYTVENFRADVAREEREKKIALAEKRQAKWRRWIKKSKKFTDRLKAKR